MVKDKAFHRNLGRLRRDINALSSFLGLFKRKTERAGHRPDPAVFERTVTWEEAMEIFDSAEFWSQFVDILKDGSRCWDIQEMVIHNTGLCASRATMRGNLHFSKSYNPTTMGIYGFYEDVVNLEVPVSYEYQAYWCMSYLDEYDLTESFDLEKYLTYYDDMEVEEYNKEMVSSFVAAGTENQVEQLIKELKINNI